MKRLLWLGLLLLSACWLFFVPIFAPADLITGFVLLTIGIVFTIVGFWNKQTIKIDKKYLIFVIPLILLALIIEFPYSLGPIILLIGIVVGFITSKLKECGRLNQLLPGLFFSGTLLSLQILILPLFVKFASRYHGMPYFSAVVSFFGNLLGLNINTNSDVLFIGAIESNPPLVLSWESIGLFIWLNFFIGFLLFLFISKKKILNSFMIFIVLSLVYGILRYLAIVFILIESIEVQEHLFATVLDIFYNPLPVFLSFIPFSLLLIKFIPPKHVELDLQWLKDFRINRKHVLAMVLVFIFIFSSVGAFAFQDPGTKKNGRILIDELHSDWEDSIRPMDTEWYGQLSTYNYYSWAEWLKHYYAVDQNENETLTPSLLNQYDILILKCPTNLYSDEEEQAIVNFVENGGGLYLIGDHTNVFGMNSYLNKVSSNFGIEFNTDATHEYAMPGGFSVHTPDKILPHPIVQFVPSFQFLTSCSLDAPITAEEVIAGERLTTFPGTYSTRDFFVEDKMWEQTRGIFLQSVALKYGKGRVVAFSDSTVFSSYCIFLSGYKEYNLGTIEYLNRENVYSILNPIFLVISIISLISLVFFFRKTEKAKAALFSISIGVLAILLATSTFSYLNNKNYDQPSPLVDFEKKVCFDMEHSGAIISPVPSFTWGDAYFEEQKQRYLTFFVWSQRIGCFPSVENNLEDAVHNGDLIIIINPEKAFSENEITSLDEFMQNGGKLLLMDNVNNSESTANDLLQYYNMDIIKINPNESLNSQDNYSAGTVNQSYLNISGGQNIITDENNQSFFSICDVGEGILAVYVDSSTFSDRYMGGVFIISDQKLNEIYGLEYYILEYLLSDETEE